MSQQFFPSRPSSSTNIEPQLHLICGPVAAGKSTYASRLANETGAIVLSMDEWMSELFVPDVSVQTTVSNLDLAWFAERVDRCERAMWQLGRKLLANRIPVVLDWGFLRRERRLKAFAVANSLGQLAQLHYLTADLATRRQRVLERNQRRDENYAFAVTPDMFAFAEHLFEAPGDDELATAIIVG
jgi:predicted kinase